MGRSDQAVGGTRRQPPPLPEGKQRDSETRLTKPEPAESTHFAPLSLGSDAFMPPVAPRSEPPEPSRRRWVVVGVAGLGVAAFGTVIALTLLVGREPQPIAPEPQALARSQVEQTSTEAAPALRPGATIAAAMPPFARPRLAAPPPVAQPMPTPAPVPVESSAPKTHASASDDDGDDDHHHRSHSHRSSRSKDKEPALDKPTRAHVLAAMSQVQRQVKACLPGGRGSLTADVKILGKTGRVTTAQINGQQGEVGSCIAHAVRRAKFPKFSSESISIRYPMAF